MSKITSFDLQLGRSYTKDYQSWRVDLGLHVELEDGEDIEVEMDSVRANLRTKVREYLKLGSNGNGKVDNEHSPSKELASQATPQEGQKQLPRTLWPKDWENVTNRMFALRDLLKENNKRAFALFIKYMKEHCPSDENEDWIDFKKAEEYHWSGIMDMFHNEGIKINKDAVKACL